MSDVGDIPDSDLYVPRVQPWDRPHFRPWNRMSGEFWEVYGEADPYTIISPDRCYVLYILGRQLLSLDGDFWECGVYRGGTAIILNRLLDRFEPHGSKTLHIFDTFSGMPEPDPVKDVHEKGDFHETSLEAVKERLPNLNRVEVHQGFMPDTFVGLEDVAIALAHVDVDLHQSVKTCCTFIYPRLVPGGFMIFDDYGFQRCPGARAAVDEYFEDKAEFPLVLLTGQALVCKLPSTL